MLRLKEENTAGALSSRRLKKKRSNPCPLTDMSSSNRQWVTVMKNGHVCLSIDKHYYSVPYRYIGKKVKLLYTSTRVEVYCRYERIATHDRHLRKYHYTTLNEHLASSHRYLSDWTPEKFMEQAGAIHEQVSTYII